MLSEFRRFEEKAAVTVPDFLISRERSFVICCELCPDRDQISLEGEGLECGKVGLKMELGHGVISGSVVCTLAKLGQQGCEGY